MLQQSAVHSGRGFSMRQRLERILANLGVGTRREVAALLRRGRVRVDGAVARSGAAKYDTLDGALNIEIAGMGRLAGAPLLAAYHKPRGVLCTMRDGGRGGRDRPCLSSLHRQHPFLTAMHPVGRLDLDTSGLLLFSREGALTERLLHPGGGVPREYEALVAGCVFDEGRRPFSRNNTMGGAERNGSAALASCLAATLRAGVATSDGVFSAELLSAAPSIERLQLSQGQVASGLAAGAAAAAGLDEVVTGILVSPAHGGEVERSALEWGEEGEEDEEEEQGEGGGANADTANAADVADASALASSGGGALLPTSRVRLRVTEGKYRMVRRVLHNAGHRCVRAKGAQELRDRSLLPSHCRSRGDPRPSSACSNLALPPALFFLPALTHLLSGLWCVYWLWRDRSVLQLHRYRYGEVSRRLDMRVARCVIMSSLVIHAVPLDCAAVLV